MPQARRRNASPTSPVLLWMDLGWKTSEMMLASAQVIGHRTALMAAASTPVSPKDQKEFTLMGQEKLDAGADSAFAMAAYLTQMNHQLWFKAFEQWLGVNTAVLSLASSRTLAQSAARQKVLGRTLSKSLDTGSKLSATTANLVKHGLEPVHATATANARRLLK